MNDFKEKVFATVKKVKAGEVKSYQEVASLAKRPKAYRVVANLLAKNRNPKIPCHRVVKNNYTVGGYFGFQKNSWLKLALLLKEGIVAVMPTDTIYGICTNAFNRKAVAKIYRLRRRNPKKPCIILISKIYELQKFGIRLTKRKREFLSKIWPAKISVILPINSPIAKRKLKYLHRGTNSLAFRLPKSKSLVEILTVSGSLIAPSANWEGYPPAKTINEAKKYFGNQVIYYPAGKIVGKPSTVIKINHQIELIRQGSDYRKIKKFISDIK